MNVFSRMHLIDYEDMCHTEYGVRVVDKKSSRLMKVLSVILFFNKNFMTEYVTTIGTTVYWPDWQEVRLTHDPIKVFKTLFHEAQHASDYRNNKFWFVVSYLSPQIWSLLSMLALLSLVGSWAWLVFLVFLISLAPIPSVYRAHYELRGSSCTMAWRMWRKLALLDEEHEEYLWKRFSGPDYYYMLPLKKSFSKELKRTEQRLLAGELTQVQKDTYKFLNRYGIVR